METLAFISYSRIKKPWADHEEELNYRSLYNLVGIEQQLSSIHNWATAEPLKAFPDKNPSFD